MNWRPYAALACDANSSLAHSGACLPYMTGQWCKERDGCEHPKYVLCAHDATPLPVLHAERHEADNGPFAACLRRSRGTVDVLFVGDSQTQMLMFEFMRWLDHGRNKPTWRMQKGAPKQRILDRSEYNLSSIQGIFVGGLYTDSTRMDRLATNLSDVSMQLRQAVRSDSHERRLALIFGVGVWDLVFSAQSGATAIQTFGTRFAWLLDEIMRIARTYAIADVVVRNVFVSYTKGPHAVLLPRLDEINHEIARRFAEARQALSTRAGSASTAHLHFHDVHALSWPRRAEMPDGSDGLHWACVTPHEGTELRSRCDAQLAANSTGRSDEVASAALQLALLKLCRIPLVRPETSF
mmetsp:Transcript_25957/g.78635  ORF Transcript_25957/g.78635 Transcript_25957/m.78635 type:complete len:352 (-) Transcript_25957:57-1112(-)